MPEHKQFRVFYSWQNDLPDHTNKNAIRQVLRGLRTELEKAHNIDVEIDEATRNVPGSPNIPQTILEKIAAADALVADVSLVNAGVPTDPKKTPNPNVLFELGFGIAHLGWNRAVLLLNDVYGKPENLPFDIDRHRVSVYRLENINDDRNALMGLCRAALASIIINNPPKPKDGFDPDASKRQRDVNQLGELLDWVHWPVLEQHIEDAPKRVSRDVLQLSDCFNGVLRSSTFHIYDTRLLDLIRKLDHHLHETTRFGRHYEQIIGSNEYKFTHSLQSDERKTEDEDFDYIESQLVLIGESMHALMKYIRENYIEIDLQRLSDEAWKKHYSRNKDN